MTRRAPSGCADGGREGLSLQQLCDELGKGPYYLRHLQDKVGLRPPGRGQRFPPGHVDLLRRVISLRTFNVPLADIADLLRKELKILEMLHVDTLHDGPDWYLRRSVGEKRTERHLLLTGQDLGFPIDAPEIQSNLNFERRDDELFNRTEMGEDVGVALQQYVELYQRVRRRVQREERVLENALIWAEQALWNPRHRMTGDTT